MSTESERPGDEAAKLREVERQVVDTRNQMIKTTNAVSNLTAELRELTRQQQRQRRGGAAASIASYIVVVLVVGAGFYFVFRSRAGRVADERDALSRRFAVAQRQLDSFNKQRSARQKAEREAASFYALLRAGRAREAIKAHPAIDKLPLSRVERELFRRWVERNQRRLAYGSYSAGMRAVGEKQWKRAVHAFERSLKMRDRPVYNASLLYYLGVAQMKLGNYQEAARVLERALLANAHKKISREARFYLAQVYEQLDRRSQAIRAYRAYVKHHPGSRLAGVARRRIRALKK